MNKKNIKNLLVTPNRFGFCVETITFIYFMPLLVVHNQLDKNINVNFSMHTEQASKHLFLSSAAMGRK